MKKAPAHIIDQWKAWRRAKDNEATAFRKTLGLCISSTCQFMAEGYSTRCAKHNKANLANIKKFKTAKTNSGIADDQKETVHINWRTKSK